MDVGSPVDLGPAPTNRFDATTAWWRHELLHRAVLAAYDDRMDRYRVERDTIEAAWVRDGQASREAFAVAVDLEARWLSEVVGTAGRDRRPGWVRRRWNGVDRACGIDAALGGDRVTGRTAPEPWTGTVVRMPPVAAARSLASGAS